jgi:hypothetical protein
MNRYRQTCKPNAEPRVLFRAFHVRVTAGVLINAALTALALALILLSASSLLLAASMF